MKVEEFIKKKVNRDLEILERISKQDALRLLSIIEKQRESISLARHSSGIKTKDFVLDNALEMEI